MTLRRRLGILPGLLLAACMATAMASASAQVPAQAPAQHRLAIGSSMPLTGPFAGHARLLASGAQLYFKHVNRQGGVHGARIDFEVLDDAFDPQRTAANARTLVADRKVLALLGLPGTAQALAALPIVQESGTPLFGPFSGSPVLRRQVLPQLFHVRASYRDELQRMVDHARTLGIQRIALFHTDDGLGQAVAGELQDVLAGSGLRLAGSASAAIRQGSFAAAARDLWRLQPQAIVVGAAGAHFGSFVAAYKALGGRWPQIYGLSVVDPGSVGAQIADAANGIVLTQIMPSVRNTALPVVREYLQVLAQERPGAEPTVLELDAFVTAKILVEGIRRAGKGPTRAGLVAALEGMGRYDAGGFAVRFSRESRNGSSFVELAMLGADGRLRY